MSENGGPIATDALCDVQDTRSRRPMLLMQLSYQTPNLPEMVLCDAPRTSLRALLWRNRSKVFHEPIAHCGRILRDVHAS
ncbi:hypothetical protein BN2476_280060 [Paraburkholderia piptadeniae]|uniref:Uncharacterized protein n=1 Tax=Paraburkholderia piptadeniae TaxID=1701573 RepID=A0A1N7S1S9_9BURK|nr:hypothetical protein BN2476_280060 [Paraburkholderia piptadeniae]